MRFLMLVRKGFWVPYLMRHPGVPLRLKVLPVLAVAYLIFPRDLVIDLRWFGMFDDIIVVGLLLGTFVSKGWKHVLAYDKRRQDSIDADFKVLVEQERAKTGGAQTHSKRSSPGPEPTTPPPGHTPKNDLRSRE